MFLPNLVILFWCCRNNPQVPDCKTLGEADSSKVSIAMVTQYGVGGPLSATG